MFISIRSIIHGEPAESRLHPLPKYRESIDWIDVNGRYLPTTITGERAKTISAIDGKKVRTTELYDVHFEWLSIDEDFNPSEFQLNRFSEAQSIFDFVHAEERAKFVSPVPK